MSTNDELNKAEVHLRKADPIMNQLIDQIGRCSLKSNEDYFGFLVRTIIGQQLSKKAAESICQRLQLESGTVTPEKILKLKKESFRKAGISEAKSNYILELARGVLKGDNIFCGFDSMLNEEIIEKLISIKGIGRWSAEMFLIFSLNRLDVLPLDDAGFLRAFKSAYKIDGQIDKEHVRKIAEPWRPYRSVAVWYLWRTLDAI